MKGAFRLGAVAAARKAAGGGGGGGGDPFWQNVSALLHFDGLDGGTTIIDETGKSWSVIGDAVTSTADKKFGVSSLLVDGTGDGAASNSASSDFAFGTGDFTVEMWVNPVSSLTNNLKCLVQPNSAYLTGLFISTNNNRLVAWYDNGVKVRGIAAISASAWSHIAAVRAAGVIRVFINGVISSESWNDSRNYSSAGAAHVGLPSATLNAFNGRIDEVRITKGVARYTSSFTPPSEPFPSS